MIFDVNFFICLQGGVGERGPAGASGPAGPRVSTTVLQFVTLLVAVIYIYISRTVMTHTQFNKCT